MKSKGLSWLARGLALALLAWPAFPQAPAAPVAPAIDRQAALDGLVAAEKAFARAAAEKGTRDAFLAFLAADSLAFKPDLVGGKDFWRSRPASPDLLLAFEVLSPRPQKPKA